MGSAASKLSTNNIGTKAKAIFFIALLLFAGAVGAMYRDNAFVFNTQDARPPPRKSLHRVHRRRPPGSELLPRGIVQKTTNFEMEASLTGNPESQRDKAPPPKKSLLAVPVGVKNKPVVDKLVSKFLDAGGFTVMLFHYDGAFEQWADLEWSNRAVHVAARRQTKWWFAKRFLHPDVVADYEYVFLWDEDIEVDAFNPARYLDVVRREGLEVSQPALDRRSEIHHAITTRKLIPTKDVHRRALDTRCHADSAGPPCVGWVEMMVPVFSRAAWKCTWKMIQNDLIHGWGIDYKLGYCAQGDRARNVGVVDTEYVLHRGDPMLSDGDKAAPSKSRGAVRWRSNKEMKMFNRRWEEAAAEDSSWPDPYAAQPATASST
ncbi:hypothetical protein ACP70R_022910 [Stipagrostis hirtigluma subsp. patula]